MKTVQDASAKRAAAELLREEEVAAPKTKKVKRGKREWCGRCTAKLGKHVPADEVVRIGDRDYAGQIRVIQADVAIRHLDTPSMFQTRSRFTALVEREKTPDAQGRKISKSRGWQ